MILLADFFICCFIPQKIGFDVLKQSSSQEPIRMKFQALFFMNKDNKISLFYEQTTFYLLFTISFSPESKFSHFSQVVSSGHDSL